jgi:hypothetical protein
MRFGWPQFYILIGAICAGKAVHWFLTPAAYAPFGFEHIAVALQVVAGGVLSWIGIRQSRRAGETAIGAQAYEK